GTHASPTGPQYQTVGTACAVPAADGDTVNETVAAPTAPSSRRDATADKGDQDRTMFRSARMYALLSIAAALLTMALKFSAYRLAGSVGLFSDAAESLVNVVAAGVAFWALTYAARPPDLEHAYGHTKAEYFSSALEGALVLFAAAIIVYQAVP